jgi:hypothetical protein
MKRRDSAQQTRSLRDSAPSYAAQRIWKGDDATNLECERPGLYLTFSATTTPYASNITYWPHGAVNALSLYNGVTETSAYNNRLQMTLISDLPVPSGDR